MQILTVDYSKAQMKIQQMAFVLVALAIFFALASLLYFSITLNNLQNTAQGLQDAEAQEIVRKMSGTPELSFTSSTDCSSCVDFDKALLLKEINAYQSFWNLDYLMIERIYPSSNNEECTRFNYPDCSRITLISSPQNNFGTETPSAFVSIARWDEDTNRFIYELGAIHASGRNVG